MPRGTPDVADWCARGPYRVGVRRTAIGDPEDERREVPVDLWYPAAAATDGEEAASHPASFPHRAIEGAPAHGASAPLVVFSHGNSGFARQSTFLTTQLASWGIAVVAPDHSGNTFPEMLALAPDDDDARIAVHKAARYNRPRDAMRSLEAALGGRLGGPPMDGGRIGALGHSFGGWTVLKLPRLEPRIRALCALAPASEAFVGRRAFEPDELPFDRPIESLVVAACEDALVDLDSSVRPLVARLAPPVALVGIEQADHFHFCDGIDVLHRMHLANPRAGALRPTLPSEEVLPEARAQRAIAGLVTAFFTSALGVGAGEARRVEKLDDAALARIDPGLRRLA